MQPKSSFGLTAKARETLTRILDHVLKDECSLSAATRDYRWNLRGPNLYSLHRLFDEQRRQLDFWLEQLIERTKSAGLGVFGRIEPLSGAKIPSGEDLPPRTMIGDLLARHEEMAHRLREDIAQLSDPATAELLTKLLEFHETTAWMLRMLHDGPDPDRAA